jgi:hypothetical protein
MTVHWTGARAPAAHSARADAGEALDPRQRHNRRARFWRVTLGALGLFWVAIILLLANALSAP